MIAYSFSLRIIATSYFLSALAREEMCCFINESAFHLVSVLIVCAFFDAIRR